MVGWLRASRVCRQAAKQFVPSDYTFPGHRTLAEVAKLPLLRLESTENIKHIWHTQHQEVPDAVGGVLTVPEIETVQHRASQRSAASGAPPRARVPCVVACAQLTGRSVGPRPRHVGSPMFILPVRREGGYFVMLSQFQNEVRSAQPAPRRNEAPHLLARSSHAAHITRRRACTVLTPRGRRT